jgi:photosystem II stability/assembly factor-like uncharacterized protein
LHTNFKLCLVIGFLLLALSGCGPFRQVNPPLATPAVTNTATSLPATPAPVPPIASLHMLDADNGWVWAGSSRLLRTTDGGQIWIDRTPEGQAWPGGSFFLDAQTVWLSIFFQENNRFGLLHTTDGGQTWTQYPYGPASGLHFTDALNGWAIEEDVGAGSVFFTLSETHDGGKTWAPIPAKPPHPENGLPPGTLHLCSMCDDSFYYDPARMIVVYGDMLTMQPGGSVRMQVSLDLGKTWQRQNLPLPQDSADALVAPYRPAFFGDKNGLLPVSLVKMNSDGSYAYQRLAFYATQDGGASWTLVPGMLEYVALFAQVQIVSPRDIYVLCGNALCVSHDGAQTWKTVVSNLDFTQNDKRSIWLLDFLDASTAWASVMENDIPTLYKTADGGVTWTQLTPLLAASAPATVNIDASIPTPTLIPTPTFETPTPNVAFDQNANAYRIRFAPYGTWVEISATISANTSKRYILSAMQGQVMSVSIPQGPAFSVNVAGADKKSLDDSRYPHPFWRGALPSTQDYIVTVESQVSGPFSLRIAINPPGQATQNLAFADQQYAVILGYTDEFAPTTVQVPAASTKGTPLLTLAFIDPTFYSPTTNLNEAYLLLTVSKDPAILSTCTQPSTQVAETVTGQEAVNGYTFTRSEFNGVAAGNSYDQISYRTVWNNKCFEVVFLIHSTNIGNYPAGTVVEFDRDALLKKFEAVLDTFLAK